MRAINLFVFITAVFTFALASSATAGDVEKGKKVFVKCGVCHSVEKDVPKVGPSLHGVMGRKAGTLASFKLYSPAMKKAGVTWDDKSIAAFLKSPREFVKGTRMIFVGLKDDAMIADLLAYLKTLK